MCTSAGEFRGLMTVVTLISLPGSTPDDEMMPTQSRWNFDACPSQLCREVQRVDACIYTQVTACVDAR
jgi:hypothetical protein